MLFAIDKNNNKIKATSKTDKDTQYYCPICKTKVIIKKGKINIPHFSHLSKTQCIYTQYYKEKAHFPRHKQMIKIISNYFKSYSCVKNIEFEQNIIENRIADVVVTLENDIKFIIECDFRKVNFDIYKDITLEYNKCGYGVLWVLDEKVIDISSQLASCYISSNNDIYSLKKNKDNDNMNDSCIDNYSKDYLRKNVCIYINKRKLLIDDTYVTRLGIGSMKGKFDTIVQYDIDKKIINN